MMTDRFGRPTQLTFEQQLARFGCCRFSLPADDPRLLTWAAACKAVGIGFTAKRQLEATGRRRGGNPLHWFATAESIDVADLAFSVFEAGRWVIASLPELADKWADA